jgi:hypothetical protein
MFKKKILLKKEQLGVAVMDNIIVTVDTLIDHTCKESIEFMKVTISNRFCKQ